MPLAYHSGSIPANHNSSTIRPWATIQRTFARVVALLAFHWYCLLAARIVARIFGAVRVFRVLFAGARQYQGRRRALECGGRG